MIFRPVVHPVLLVLIVAVAATFVFLSAKRAARKRVMDIIRRSFIVVTVIIMGAGPSIPGQALEVTSALEVYLVIDRTGSMAAEDWDGTKPRIDGVRNDVALIMNTLAGSRFSILTWDSSVHTDMPLTSDASAVASYMDSFNRELSASSQGSSLNRPAADLAALLAKNKERHPQNLRAVFIFSDGETSNQEHWKSAPTGSEEDWDRVKEYVDGGLVIGYGTPEGGPMKVLRLGNSEAQSGDDDGYIHDLSQPGNPIAISKIDEAALQAVASRIGVDYVHSPDKSAIESHARTILDGASEIAEQRNMKDTYRYIIWPFALLLGGLLAWEGANLALRAQQLRNSHAL
mgnify:FL=1